MNNIMLYTDGACRGNGQTGAIGGYGIVTIINNEVDEFRYATKNTTNNKMELLAVVDGLIRIKDQSSVTVFSDSAYVVNAINNNWINGWIAKGWVTASKTPVKNRDLWEQLIVMMQYHKVKFVKVKGHSDNEYNNRCDELANIAMNELC